MSKFAYLYTDPTGSGEVVGRTPYGIYDADEQFQSESLQVTKYVARKLGHPVMQLEFNSGSVYATFEEAVSEYSTQINNYNMRNWLWDHYGATNRQSGSAYNTTGSHEVESPHMGTTFMLSEQYGEAVNIGGGLQLYSGSISLTSSKQIYNLETDSTLTGSHTNKRLEILRIFNEGPSAITRFYDPFAGSFEQRQMLDAFGMGNVAPAVSFIMRPISFDIARAQAIETNDKVRKSNYSFELINNELRIFPRPTSADSGSKVYFQYYVKEDKQGLTRNWTDKKVSDPSNAPYKFIPYEEINSTGRQWIRKFTLATSKELLGIIRSKYASLPLPNGEVSMDGEALKAEGREEKTNLSEELSEFLEAVSKKEQALSEQEVANAQQEVLNKAPLKIYIG